MGEEVQIVINLSSDWHLSTPKFECYIDDKQLDGGELTERKADKQSRRISWTGKLEEGDHLIRVVLKDKGNRETLLHPVDQTILKDQLLHIESVSIDQIDLGHLVHRTCKFYPNKTLRPDLDDVIPNLTCIGYNGECQIKFTVPTYLWLLEHF